MRRAGKRLNFEGRLAAHTAGHNGRINLASFFMGEKMKESKAERPLRGVILLPDEVAERLRVSQKTVYNMAADGDIPSLHVRSLLRFDSADIDDYLFFAKFHDGLLKLSSIDQKEIISRLEEQVEHTKRYLEKYFSKPKPKEAAMKV